MNKYRFSFSKKYFLSFLLLLAIEIIIALYIHDRIIRPYVGDTLVVLLIYCFVKTFFPLPYLTTAIGVLVFSYCIEYLQYQHFVQWLGLGKNTFANIVLGNSFAWEDILAYTLGFVIIILVEKYCRVCNKPKKNIDLNLIAKTKSNKRDFKN